MKITTQDVVRRGSEVHGDRGVPTTRGPGQGARVSYRELGGRNDLPVGVRHRHSADPPPAGSTRRSCAASTPTVTSPSRHRRESSIHYYLNIDVKET